MDGNFCSRVSGHMPWSLSNSLRHHHHLLYLLGLYETVGSVGGWMGTFVLG
jgi:hypothetical protein